MSITQKTAKNRPSISSTDKNWYSEDEIASIKKVEFEKGKEHFNQVQLKQYTDNLLKAQDVAEKHFISVLTNFGIKLKQIRLKPISISSFELIFIMPESDFLSIDNYRKVVEDGVQFINEYSNNKFYISFMYMPHTNNINDTAFLLDGFYITYDPFRKK